MDSEISGTVLRAAPRITGNGKTVYDIEFSDGNTYATFDAAIFAKVTAVGQQAATARVSVQQKGQYTNFYLNDIAPAGQLAATSAPVATAPQAARPPQSGGMSPEREQKIVKQSSFATAFKFVGLLYQGSGDSEVEHAQALAHNLAHELYAHVMGDIPPDPPNPTGKPPEPVAAAAATNGVAGAAEVPKDAIPWL